MNKAFGLELEGNKIQFNTTNTAAGQIKDANSKPHACANSQPSLAAWLGIRTVASRKECDNAIEELEKAKDLHWLSEIPGWVGPFTPSLSTIAKGIGWEVMFENK